MRIGFTGTREVPEDVVPFLRGTVEGMTTLGTEFVTGACRGFDAMVARWMAECHPTATHRLIVPANRSQVDEDLISNFQHLARHPAPDGGTFIVEFMPEGTSYKQRNEHIVDHSEYLVAAVGYPEDHRKSIRSGSWQTVRIARRRGVPERVLTLSEF